MKRNLTKKLCIAVFFCAFVCGNSAAPVLAAITVSGKVMTISKSGEDETVDEAVVKLFKRGQAEPLDQVTSDANGLFSITVGGDELVDVYFLTTKASFVDTYTQFFSFSEDEDEFEVPLLPAKETQDVINSVAETAHPVFEGMGIIAGAVELLVDDDFSSVAGVQVKLTEYDGNPRPCNVLYLDLDDEDEPFWNPELTETSETGVFALYNIDIPPPGYRGVLLVLENADPKYFFNRTDTIVFPYKAGVESPEKISIANVIGWEPGAGEDTPIDDGGGGGGGCFVSGVSP
jgi:hypothetical protein